MYAHVLPKVSAIVMAMIGLSLVDSTNGSEVAAALALPFSAAVAYLVLGSSGD